MIQLPRRSVTRFFIPLIDVMTLLFCIFLLMPMFPKGENTQRLERKLQDRERELKQRNRQLAELQKKLDALRSKGLFQTSEAVQKELERLHKELDKAKKDQEELQRLRVQVEKLKQPLQDKFDIQVLGIDGDTGKLYYSDPDRFGERRLIKDKAEAQALIRRLQAGVRGRKLYFLLLLPRSEDASHPTKGEKDAYLSWFEGVDRGLDFPRSGV
jgi:hypothetical protein